MRTRLALQGLAVVLIGGGIQLYLQLVRFPHLTYDPQTPLFVFRYNLYVHMWGDGALALAPVWLAVIYGLRRVPQLVCTPEDAVALAAGALYLPLWMCVGLLSEVRIYLPFLLVLSPLAALAVGRSLGWTSPRVGLAGTQTAATCAFE